MKILVTGKDGQLGRALQHSAKRYEQFDWIFCGREELDLERPDSISPYIKDQAPDVVINAAAYTQVDLAEQEPDLAYRINAEAVKSLAESCQQLSANLIHISTDYVYHGSKNSPYLETDPINPKNVYAQSKAKGENYVLQGENPGMVIRTSWLYAPQGKNFVNTMLRLGKEKNSIDVVDDQIGSPTYAPDLAEAICQAIQKGSGPEKSELLQGVYNFSNEGACSWYDFAWNIMELAGLDCRVNPVPSSAFPRPASRPSFSLMSKEKIRKALDLNIPHWQDALRRCIVEAN